MNKLSHEILLSLAYVSQISDPDSVRSRFIESLNGLDKFFCFEYADRLPSEVPEHRILPIATLRSSFGYAVMADFPATAEAELAVFRSAFQFLAVILENRTQAQMLEKQNLSLLKEIRQEKSLLHTVLNTLPVGVWVANESGIVIMGNTAGEKIWGDIHSGVVNQYREYKAWHSDTGDRVGPEEWAIVLAIKTGETLTNQEFQIECVDGTYKTILNSAAPLFDDERRIIGSVGVYQDITERKLIEKETKLINKRLQQAQKMEAIGTLAGGIAHDFNNILGIILGYADMAKDDAPPGTKYQQDLDKVLSAANRAKGLVEQILAFSRQTQIERLPIKIQPLIKEGMKMLRSSLPTTISITENIDPKSGTVLADPTHIHQILMNLCTNAYHAMEAAGGELSVTVKTTFIKPDDQKMLSHAPPGEYVEFIVTDTGVGIGPDDVQKIFDPYFTTKEIGKGTGMGLAIIHGIMINYGGAITVDSQLGQGSTFHVYFPVIEKEAVVEIKKSEGFLEGKERILFIDDEEILAEMGKDMLERLGYHVTVRRSSVEALATFQNTPTEFDLVITDQTMPDMTGADLARRMLQLKPDIPIILCTGYSNLVDEDSAKALGIKEFVLKPLTKSVIAKLIRNTLGQKN